MDLLHFMFINKNYPERDIDELMAECLAQMRKEGRSEQCIGRHQYMWEKSIVPYMKRNGITSFSRKIGDKFINEILPHFKFYIQKCIRASIHLLEDFLETNRTVIKRRPHEKKTSRTVYTLVGEIGEAIQKDLDYLQSLKFCKNTVSGYRYVLSVFCSKLASQGITKISELTESIIIDYIDNLKRNKRKSFYIIRQFCTYLYYNNYTTKDLGYVLSSNNLPVGEMLPSYYTEEEIKQMEDSIELWSDTGKRAYAIFMLASRTGMRAGDIATLTKKAINVENMTITFCQQKTHIPTELPLLPEVAEAIYIYARYARPKSDCQEIFLTAISPYNPIDSDTVFNVISSIIKKSGVDIGNRHFGVHTMRHSLASNLLKKGVSIAIISAILGHASTKTTMAYLRIDESNLIECELDVPEVDDDFYTQEGGNVL